MDVLLLDKTGTITLGNRQATAFFPAAGVTETRPGRRRPARLAGRRDAGGAQHRRPGQGEVRDLRERDVEKLGATFVAFTAQTRMSGVNLNGRQVRKGAADAIEAHVTDAGRRRSPRRCARAVDTIAQGGRHAARGVPTAPRCSA